MSGPSPVERPLGATPESGGTTFRVWAPRARTAAVELAGATVPLDAAGRGVFEGVGPAAAGDDYAVRLDGAAPLPDPCSRSQPAGVAGPSRVVDPAAFDWDEGGWRGLDRDDLVIYELHVGTFTGPGTFAAAAERLPALRALGVTAVELMPVATFPGLRNWGYDGLYAWAPHHVYGGPEGLAALVAAAHREGIGVVLDVVYNHLGPGEERLAAFGPYSSSGSTPWGRTMNFDGPDSGGVREWAIQNACMWLRDMRIDGLRLDAVHAIHDEGPRHVLAELTDRARAASRRPPVLIAESDLNDPKVLRPASEGGWGFDAQWSDDLHHAVHAAATGERGGYYADFGSVADVAAATERRFAYDGRWSPRRRRCHGAPAADRPPGQFVVYAQDHDQVGNRALGDRLAPPAARLAAMWVLLSPFVPMIFMGEEHGETRPFLYFTDHPDPAIAAAARRGRRRELAAFGPLPRAMPDPQDPATMAACVLRPEEGDAEATALYRALLRLRRELPRDEGPVRCDERAGWAGMRRGAAEVVGNFGRGPVRVPVDARELVLASGPGAELRPGALDLPSLTGAVVR
ncbi:MAG: malto-oligosyltrehalose trehalohydrolase [Thermoleophilia bacterium]